VVLGLWFESARAMFFLFMFLNALPVPMLRQVGRRWRVADLFSCVFSVCFSGLFSGGVFFGLCKGFVSFWVSQGCHFW
jgi:hypothetical protein